MNENCKTSVAPDHTSYTEINEEEPIYSERKRIIIPDSPSSPTPLERQNTIRARNTSSLYDILTAKEQAACNKRLDFSGRLATPLGQAAILYPQFLYKEAMKNAKQ